MPTPKDSPITRFFQQQQQKGEQGDGLLQTAVAQAEGHPMFNQFQLETQQHRNVDLWGYGSEPFEGHHRLCYLAQEASAATTF